MPLFELYQMTKEKLDSAQQKNPSSLADLSYEPENDLVELVWENGQIMMQGQTSRNKKNPTSSSLPSHCLPSYTPKTKDKDIGNGTNTKIGKFGAVDSVLNEIPLSVPSVEMGLNQDDDMVPWLNYPVDESLQHEYCPDFLPKLSGVTGNGLSTLNNFALFDKRSGNNLFNREFNTGSAHNDSSLAHGSMSRISSAGSGEATRPKSSYSELYTSSSSLQQCQTSFPYLRSRISDSTGNSMKNLAQNAVFGDSNATSGSFPGLRMQKQDQRMPSSNSGVMNFSHFTRPVALVKANLQNIGFMPGSGLSNIERIQSKNKSSVASSNNPVESMPIDFSGCLRREASAHSQPVGVPSKGDVKPSEEKPSEKPASAEPPEAMSREDHFNNDTKPSHTLGESMTKGLLDSEKTTEPVIVASSVCSANSVERASDEPTHNLKRKHRETEESEGPSEDLEEESVGVKKAVPARVGTGSKRSRAAEVHNLSERRRRDRINEKMRALQQLIPNCNKVDKASMLDEAIEYLKTLQLQVQIMSMGTGLYMPTMMFPGMQPMHAAHMAHFSPMGIGIGMGVGYGMGMLDMNGSSSCYPMVQVPAMHGAHFPGPTVSGPTALQGMAGSDFQLFGLHGQGHPILMPHGPVTPASGGPMVKSAMGLNACGMGGRTDNLDAATGTTAKDPMQNVNPQMQSTLADSSMNQKSSQCLATNEGFAQPPAVPDNCQASEVTGLEAVKSSNKNENESDRAAC